MSDWNYNFDLSQAEDGDWVMLRCGGECQIDRIVTPEESYYAVYIGPFSWFRYRANGLMWLTPAATPLDIIALQKQFKWSQVRPGMAFYHEHDQRILYFARTSFFYKNNAIVEMRNGFSDVVSKSFLTRAPGFDVGVDDG